MWKPDKDDTRLVCMALMGATLFAGLELLSPDKDFGSAAMIGSILFPVVRLLMNRQPIIMVMPDLVEVDHTVSPTTVTTNN